MGLLNIAFNCNVRGKDVPELVAALKKIEDLPLSHKVTGANQRIVKVSGNSRSIGGLLYEVCDTYKDLDHPTLDKSDRRQFLYNSRGELVDYSKVLEKEKATRGE